MLKLSVMVVLFVNLMSLKTECNHTSNHTDPEILLDEFTHMVGLNSTDAPFVMLGDNSTEFMDETDTMANETKIYTTRFIFNKLMWWADDYTLSILIPVSIGLGVGFVLLVCLCCTKRIREKLRRRKYRNPKMTIRDDIRKMRHVDRMKLLAESSEDEEFN